mmetsp:Transcript_9952/g.22728  ORF Transcript_9952/g.22728 Transcript_9952/m.22728 type:complete len:212 (-) Transcript_9952:122-757(-)
MSEAQMKFLEERRRQRGSEAQQATGEAPPDSSHELGQRYTGYGSFEAQSEVLPVIKTEDVWTCKCGDGRLGSYFVAFHKPSGAAVELLQDTVGGFSFQRARGSQIKYCTPLGSIQDENSPFAPSVIQSLANGGGARLLAGTDTGAWGNVKDMKQNLVLKVRVQERSGEECAELHFTVDGFIFKSASGAKNVLVKRGEFSVINLDEFHRLVR